MVTSWSLAHGPLRTMRFAPQDVRNVAEVGAALVQVLGLEPSQRLYYKTDRMADEVHGMLAGSMHVIHQQYNACSIVHGPVASHDP